MNCWSILFLSAQEKSCYGFYGKSAYIDVSLAANSPLLYKYFNRPESYSDVNNQLINPFNANLTFQIGKYFKNNKGIALSFSSMKLQSFSPNDFKLPNEEYKFIGNFDPFYSRTTTIMPIYTASYFDNAPLGIELEAGIGYNTTKIINNGLNYHAAYSNMQTYESNLLKNKTVFDFNQKFYSISFMFGIKTRYALTKNLLLNLGLRYNLSTLLKNKSKIYNSDKYATDFDDRLVTSVGKTKSYRFLVLGIGLTYCF